MVSRTWLMPPQLWVFLEYLEEEEALRKVLDCGAGGSYPKMISILREGFEVEGIEIDPERKEQAEKFGKENGLSLKIQIGDMRALPFPDNHFDAAYSYNTIFHMIKAEMKVAVKEVIRVIKPGGLGFINFMGMGESRVGVGEEIGPGEHLLEERGEKIIHSFHHEDEGDKYFQGVKILQKSIYSDKIWFEDDNQYYVRETINYYFKKD